MDRKIAADVIDAIADVAPRIPLPGVPHAAVAIPVVASLLKALADVLRREEVTTDELVARIRRAEPLAPPPWHEGKAD